jgi:hypothetical protein
MKINLFFAKQKTKQFRLIDKSYEESNISLLLCFCMIQIIINFDYLLPVFLPQRKMSIGNSSISNSFLSNEECCRKY